MSVMIPGIYIDLHVQNVLLLLIMQFLWVRKIWCTDALNIREDFRHVVFVDESIVEMPSSGRLFFHQALSLMQKTCARRPKPTHEYKVCECCLL